MRYLAVYFFILFNSLVFSQERQLHTYKFDIQSIKSYQDAKPYFNNIRITFSEIKSVNHLLYFDVTEHFFKVQSTINFNRETLEFELKKIGLVLKEFIKDGILEE